MIEVEAKTRWGALMEWKSELPNPWSKIDISRKQVLLCSLRDKVRTLDHPPCVQHHSIL
jgi:hypothetical protein